jgi:prepilin-type N-terminal cleavage/methylation domain-containing protein
MNPSRAASPRRGFTLIELLVVIAIIGILSATVMVSLNVARMKARDTRRVQDLTQIRTALELYFFDHGYYPAVACGWDCNGYAYSYHAASWNALAAELEPYIATLPKDPVNSGCAPWSNGCYSYTYGNVWRDTHPSQYDLTAQLENHNSDLRCEVRKWTYWYSDAAWCPNYSNYIYEASPD